MRASTVAFVSLVALAGLATASAASARSPQTSPRVLTGAGVGVRASAPWGIVQSAPNGAITDPVTVLVVGTPRVAPAVTSQCQIAAYRIPADGAAVVIVRWRTVTSGGGRPPQGRAALEKLTHVSRPSFECFNGRGAVAQLALRGHAYQVSVLVGNRATPRRVEQALAVARSFDLAQ